MKTLIYAWRFLMRSKAYTFINLVGLSFSLACCLVLIRYIHRELTVDTHGVQLENVVVTLRDIGGNVYLGENPGVSEEEDRGIPADQIIEHCFLVENENENLIYNEVNYKTQLLAADSTFFHFFRYPLVVGEAALDAPDAAILTRSFAERIFGKENPIGKILQYGNYSLTVKGVIDQPECKTTWHFDILVSRQLKKTWEKLNIELMRVLPGLDLDKLNAKSFVYKEINKDMWRYKFIPWKDVYFEPTVMDKYDSILQFGNRDYLYILSGVTLLLLVVGVLNFVNLYMVFMMKRSREYGIKKVFGLSRIPLFIEIWLENFLLVAMSLFLAWLFVEVLQGVTERLLGEAISYTWFDCYLSVGVLCLLPVLTSLYPYIKYNYLQPVTSMRMLATSRLSVATRIVFLFFQYSISLSLIMMALYFSQHFHLLTETPPGFRTEGILRADLYHRNWDYWNERSDKTRQQQALIKQKLAECPFIEQSMYSHETILGRNSVSQILNDKDVSVQMEVVFTSADFFQLYDLQVVDGLIEEAEEFGGQMVLNQAAMKALGYKKREEAFIRSESPLWIGSRNGQVVHGGMKLMPVNAVIADYYSGHLSEGVKPMAFIVSPPSSSGASLIRVKEGKEKQLMEYLRNMEQEVYNTTDFDYQWLEDEVADLYKDDRRIARIYSWFAGVAVFVSCLGLFGLSLFDIRRRYKEIGIRKVNGAQVRDICFLLFKKYVLVLVSAFVVSTAVSVYFILRYTENFAVKAPLGAGIFLWSLLLVSVISLGTLFWQVNRAARINPADVVKRE